MHGDGVALDQGQAFPKDEFFDELRRVFKSNPLKQSIVINALSIILPELIAQAERRNVNVSNYTAQAWRIIDDLDTGIRGSDWGKTRNELLKSDQTMLWQHQPPPTLSAGPLFFGNRRVKESICLNSETIESVTKRYLSYDWYSEYLDWVIIDLLAFCEYRVFNVQLSVSILMQRSMVGFYAVSCGIIGGILLWQGFVTLPDWSILPGWSVPVGVLLLQLAYGFADGRWIAKFANRKILRGMYDAYRALKGTVLSPTRVREAFQSAEKDGVVWPTTIWPVLDRVVARNSAVWNVWPR
jgi:hypothetical protein